ncbi:MAG: hypothetical protein HZB50_02535 [Chloroflexi bacterium]|nr:hypothetical protein [Chloroflexota bacterium]
MANRSKINEFFIVLFAAGSLLTACAPTLPETDVPVITPTKIISLPTQTTVPQPTVTATPAFYVHQSAVEVVTDQAVTGDGGNNWGGHQSRIVHTQDGIFTAYTVEGKGKFHREWRLVKREVDGSWNILATGDAGREPVNLLAAPDGTLYVVGWPNETGTLWQGKPEKDNLVMTSSKIPGVAKGNWPYASAGINASGDLCILSSIGGEAPGGEFKWSCYYPSTGEWVSQTSKIDYRFCYTYVFPGPDGQLSLISTRDVRWGALKYKQPMDAFDYVFNAYGFWQTEDTANIPIKRVHTVEEAPTELSQFVMLSAQQDAYMDTRGRMHIIYRVQGQSTNNEAISRHAILAQDGTVLADESLPSELGWEFSRIFQDKKERFYLLTSNGYLYPMDKDGIELGEPIQLDLGLGRLSSVVEYSGFGLSVPRTGTPLSDVMDVVFPTSNGTAWMYFQLDFSDDPANAETSNQPQPSSNSSGTPAPTPSFQSLLDTSKVFFDLDLSDPNLPGMDWWGGDRSTLQYQNGSLILDGAVGPQLHSPYGLKKGEACLALLRFSGTQDFQFKAMTENWNEPTGASWGIASGPGSFYQVAQGDFHGTPFAGLSLSEDHWYYFMLWVNDSATFTARIWKKENPNTFGEKIFHMDDKGSMWSSRHWYCDILVNAGKVEMASYKELKIIQMP